MIHDFSNDQFLYFRSMILLQNEIFIITYIISYEGVKLQILWVTFKDKLNRVNDFFFHFKTLDI